MSGMWSLTRALVSRSLVTVGRLVRTLSIVALLGALAHVAFVPSTVSAKLGVPPTDLAITKTDGVTTVVPGGSVTYTITASNAGPSDAAGSTVGDTFPAVLTTTWTCVGAGGGTCT